MKHECDLIQDLLPLYEEGLCSQASRAAVEAHLQECAACRALTKALPEVKAPTDVPQADQAVRKGIRKVRRRWLISLIAAVLIVPVLLLSVNQVRGRGICFTNADDYFAARRFLTALEDRDWETAAAMDDFAGDYESILEALDQPVSAWGLHFTPVTIGETDYMQTMTGEQYDLSDAAQVFGFVYNRWGRVFLDAALWEEVCAVDPGAVVREGNQYEINHETYFRFETPWGDYVGNMDISTATPYDICFGADLVPREIWLDASTALQDNAQSVYDATHEDYGYVAQMTEADFLEHMRLKYAEDLSALEDLGFTIEHTGFQHTYRQGDRGGWVIAFGVRVTCQGEAVDAAISISVDHGKVRFNGVSHPAEQDHKWMMDLNDILYPSAHPDY